MSGDTKTPGISIVIPTYRRPHLVGDAIRSALLEGSGTAVEILVLENPSPETRTGEPTQTERLIRSLGDPRIGYRRNATNLGMAGNWNEGLSRARGEWILLLHDDDWLEPGYTGAMRAALRRFPDALAIGCQRSDVRGGPLERRDERPAGPRMLRARVLSALDFLERNPFPVMSGVLFRREPALAAGGFEPALFPSSDYAMWLTLALSGSAVLIDAPLVSYRIVENESQRPETILQMVLADLAIRQRVIARSSRGTRALSLYSRYKCLEHVRDLSRFWGTEVDAASIADRVGLTDGPARAAARLVFRSVRRSLRLREASRRWQRLDVAPPG